MKHKKSSRRGANISIDRYPGGRASLKQPERFADTGKKPATFAHGVRSPLNAIMGAVVLLRERYADEGTLIELTKIMEQEILRLDSFIAGFFSTGISDQAASEVDLISVLKKIEALISLQVQSCKIETSFEYVYTSGVMINSSHLEHAILNVINNAIDAMPSGGTLSVKTQAGTISGRESAVIEISDTGTEMTRNDRRGISSSSKKKGKGSGLFITREILRSYGGHLEINSRKNQGTIVKLYVPTGQLPV
jgi:two-component system nitrogen regulation sensor histidine kinase GlnL